MKNLRRNFERFCYRHRNKGIPNLMLYVALGTAVVYLIASIDPSGRLVHFLTFDRSAILQGQVWRLVSYILVPQYLGIPGILLLAISLYFFWFIGKALESQWGTFRFNLFYFTGVILTDLAALLLGVNASIDALNLSLILSFATMYPENRVLLLYIIPIKMKYLAWVYLGLTAVQVLFSAFPYNLFPVCALLNYFLFFGADILHVLPDFMRPRKKSFGNFGKQQKPNPNWAKNYRSSAGEQPYRHKCTVCGRTDVTNPELEFRYCSQCKGYYCYCLEHIGNHAHIQ